MRRSLLAAATLALAGSAAAAQTSPAPAGADLSAQAGPLAPVLPDLSAMPTLPMIGVLPHDLSPWGMFVTADIVVKAVMVGLAFASLVTWTVWLAKSLELAGSTARLRQAAKRIGAAPSLVRAAEMAGTGSGPAAEMVRSAAVEVAVSANATGGLKERVASRLDRLEIAAGRRMMRGTGVLATIGSTAPFVGLFGTVWGIMNAFVGISKAQTTNLAVVAPGIAEALLATAIGLVAAIPAVVIYNVFARAIAGYRARLADVSAAIQQIVSRDLDRSREPSVGAAG